MAETKSRPYTINNESVSFTIGDDKFSGLSIKNSTGLFVPEDNTSSKFNTLKAVSYTHLTLPTNREV